MFHKKIFLKIIGQLTQKCLLWTVQTVQIDRSRKAVKKRAAVLWEKVRFLLQKARVCDTMYGTIYTKYGAECSFAVKIGEVR